MAKITGTVEKVKTSEEGKDVVLRYVLKKVDNDRIACEMRGRKITGVLDNGDEVLIKGRRSPGRNGLMSPKSITNLSTSSVVQVTRRGVLGKLFAFVFSFAVSIGSGVLTSTITAAIVPQLSGSEVGVVSSDESSTTSRGVQSPSITDDPMDALLSFPIEILAGVAVAILVFSLIYVRPSRR